MTTTKTATGAVVDFIQSARFADFPAEALTIGKRCIVDGLGVMLAGSTQDAGHLADRPDPGCCGFKALVHLYVASIGDLNACHIQSEIFRVWDAAGCN